jgi:NAD(P)-dependent dehydrogenase (short-subunit alcohol dehydrogenase family)
MDTRLDGLVAVVTGSGSGIGRGIALKLAERGAITVINDIVEEKINKTVEAIEQSGGKAVGFVADVSNKEKVESLFNACFEINGRVDILVNNAGIADDAMIEDMSESQWDRVIDVNLKGAFLSSQAALQYMRKGKYGRIINISAEDVFFGEVGMVNYHCSKFGMFGLTIAVANEMARWVREEGADMTCNCITPGYLETAIRSQGSMSDLRKETKKYIPLGRECNPIEDSGNMVAFLASRESGYITSNILNAGGGLFMNLIC